jgi:uncharacterized protein (AIM24 family)
VGIKVSWTTGLIDFGAMIGMGEGFFDRATEGTGVVLRVGIDVVVAELSLLMLD